jgi:uncharacterized protein
LISGSLVYFWKANETTGKMMGTQNFEQAKRYALGRLEQELPQGLYYHNLSHTKDDVLPATVKLAEAEGVQGEALELLLTAAWFHDLGFIETRAGHEIVSARFASEVLPGFGYSEDQIQTVQRIIMATVVPQNPHTLLESIMADADLDVLGREDFMLCNDNLRRELAFFGQEFSNTQWFSGQLEFVETHTYFTGAARSLRVAGQAKNVTELKKRLTEI